MFGTQAPKGLGILFVFVGVPLILWDAAGTKDELDALDASSDGDLSRSPPRPAIEHRKSA